MTFRRILGGSSLVVLVGCGADDGGASGGDGQGTGIVLSTGGTTADDDDFNPNDTELPPTTTANPDDQTSGCGEVSVTLESITPTIMLLVDQSGSMTTDFNGLERWDAVYETLMDPVDGVVVSLEQNVRFGLTLYSSENGDDGGECPMLTAIPPALNNFAAIDAVYALEAPIDETPTGESLDIVAVDLAAFPEEGPKAIVLCTDGEPDTCAEPNPQNGQPEAIAAAQNAFAMDIKTFVIAVGDEVGAPHLQEMANVGVGKMPNDPMPAPYYEALDAGELVDAFNDIIGTFISCELTIDGMVDVGQACEGTVLLDGMVLECGTDWEVPDEDTLLILGEACDLLKDGNDHSVEASWPCDAVVVP
jgi:hypothetical protein